MEKPNILHYQHMESHIDEEVGNLLKEKNLSGLFKDQVRPILTTIGNDFRDDITALERKYGIPIGTLGTSFDLTAPGIGSISIGAGRNIDAMDGIAENLSNIIGWISGILAAVVTYVVGPLILLIVINIVAIICTTFAAIYFNSCFKPWRMGNSSGCGCCWRFCRRKSKGDRCRKHA